MKVGPLASLVSEVESEFARIMSGANRYSRDRTKRHPV